MQHHTLEQTIHNDIFIWLLTYLCLPYATSIINIGPQDIHNSYSDGYGYPNPEYRFLRGAQFNNKSFLHFKY